MKIQGVVFDRVIQEVCDSSRIDFEESGVDQHTLEDLRKVRQNPVFIRLPCGIPVSCPFSHRFPVDMVGVSRPSCRVQGSVGVERAGPSELPPGAGHNAGGSGCL